MDEAEIKTQTEKLGLQSDETIKLYKYIDLKGATMLLSEGCFKFSRSKEFNDPFDLYDGQIDFKRFEFQNTQQFSRHDRRILHRGREKAARVAWKQQKSNFGISCFSKKYDDILMWSHYADKHKGVCLEFEINANRLLEDEFFLFAVEYTNEFSLLSHFDKDLNKSANHFQQYISTKALPWQYEEEIRIVHFDYFKKDRSQFLSFEKYAKITSVMFGWKMVKDDMMKLQKSLRKHKSVTCYQMQAVDNQFGLTRILYV